MIGRYLCEQIRVHARGFLPQLFGTPTRNDRGIGGEHIYMPRFTHRLKDPGFIRGYQMQFWNTGSQPTNLPALARRLAGFRRRLQAGRQEALPRLGGAAPVRRDPPIPRTTGSPSIPSKPDRYGTPMLHIEYTIGDNERKMAEHIFDTLEEVGKAAGIEWVDFKRGVLDNNGSAIHEHGCCRMGEDPKRSALNAFNQMHEVKNVFVVDGSAFTSASEKNPTLTILSLSWRATDYLARRDQEGESLMRARLVRRSRPTRLACSASACLLRYRSSDGGAPQAPTSCVPAD